MSDRQKDLIKDIITCQIKILSGDRFDRKYFKKKLIELLLRLDETLED